MGLIVSGSAGFCYGVKRALAIIEKEKTRHERLYTYGPLIHNPAVIRRLEEEDVIPTEDFSGLACGQPIVLRTHGIERETESEMRAMGLCIVDTTCPFVKNAQNKAASLAAAGYQVNIFGDPFHPEVRSILSYAGPAGRIVSGLSDVPGSPAAKTGLLSQTTSNKCDFSKICALFSENAGELRIFNTICSATFERQKDTVEIAQKVDFMIIVGGKNSANTNRLRELAERYVPSKHIESADELTVDELRKYATIGITAGASTPDFSIGEVIDFVNRIVGGN